MSLGKVYTYPSEPHSELARLAPFAQHFFVLADNWRVKRIQAVAALSGASVEEVHIEMAKTKSDEYLQKFPVGCVPAFEGADGVNLTESAAIAEYGESERPASLFFAPASFASFFLKMSFTTCYPCLNDCVSRKFPADGTVITSEK